MCGKQIYFKLFKNGNNLILVTPNYASCIEKINQLEGTKLDYRDYSVGPTQRFINNYRILKVKL